MRRNSAAFSGSFQTSGSRGVPPQLIPGSETLPEPAVGTTTLRDAAAAQDCFPFPFRKEVCYRGMVSCNNASELAAALASQNARGELFPAVDLRRLNRVLELTPEDMTVTVETGISFETLQHELARHRQWLPLDPPHAERISVHDILARDLSGPRRFGYGTVREHLIGMKAVLADGRIIKSGGRVVKNVAGFDLAKLFIGARDSLGIVVEATFKLRPLPEMERLIACELTPNSRKELWRAVRESELTPVILDVYRLDPAAALTMVLGLAGTRAEVEWQLERARSLGFTAETNLDYEARFWSDSAPVNRWSVLPSTVFDRIARLGGAPFVARAGNGVIYTRAAVEREQNTAPETLTRRLKESFDPRGILPAPIL